jgi:hypothetical protein
MSVPYLLLLALVILGQQSGLLFIIKTVCHLSVAFGTSLFSAMASFIVKASQVGWVYSTHRNELGVSFQFLLPNALRTFSLKIGGKVSL